MTFNFNYSKAYKEMANTGRQFNGLSILQHKEYIREVISKTKSESLIDWGCGGGGAYKTPYKVHKFWGLDSRSIKLYDPNFKEHYKRPKRKADIVLCSDVLEHIPEEGLDEFITDLFSHANKAVWASVCCRPAKKTFPGTDINVHCTIRPYHWWEGKMKSLAVNSIELYLVETY